MKCILPLVVLLALNFGGNEASELHKLASAIQDNIKLSKVPLEIAFNEVYSITNQAGKEFQARLGEFTANMRNNAKTAKEQAINPETVKCIQQIQQAIEIVPDRISNETKTCVMGKIESARGVIRETLEHISDFNGMLDEYMKEFVACARASNRNACTSAVMSELDVDVEEMPKRIRDEVAAACKQIQKHGQDVKNCGNFEAIEKGIADGLSHCTNVKRPIMF